MNRIFGMLVWKDPVFELEAEQLEGAVSELTVKNTPPSFHVSLHWYRSLKPADRTSLLTTYRKWRASGCAAQDRELLILAEVERIERIVSVGQAVRRIRTAVLKKKIEERDEFLPKKEVRLRQARRAFASAPVEEDSSGRFCPDCFGMSHRRPFVGPCLGCGEFHHDDVVLVPIPTAGCGLGEVA